MFEKFLSLFRSQVQDALIAGADDGLNQADVQARVKASVEDGVREALDSLHELLTVQAGPARRQSAETNGHVGRRTAKSRS